MRLSEREMMTSSTVASLPAEHGVDNHDETNNHGDSEEFDDGEKTICSGGSDNDSLKTCSDSEYEYEEDDDMDLEGISRVNIEQTFRRPPVKEQRGFLCSSSRCHVCRREDHTPIKDCRTLTRFQAKRDMQPTISPDALLPALSSFIQATANRHPGMTLEEAGILCRQGNWRSNVDLDRIVYQEEELAVGTATQATKACDICYEETLPATAFFSMRCGHSYCRTCWEDLISNSIRDQTQAALLMTCPERTCRNIVTEVQIQEVAPNLLPAFNQRQLESFVEANKTTVRWCPGADCSYAAVLPAPNLFEDENLNFRCNQCNLDFCFCCMNPKHEGGCDDFFAQQRRPDPPRRMRIDPAEALDSREREEPLRKECPKCSTLIEKTGGCNRMRCKCGHYFCWLCLGDMPDYSHYCGQRPHRRRADAGIFERPVLNRVTAVRLPQHRIDLNYVFQSIEPLQPQVSGSQLAALQSIYHLREYAHFYNRFFIQGRAQSFASAPQCLAAQIGRYVQVFGFQNAAETDFFERANKTVEASRRLLKYSYVAAYDNRILEASHFRFYQMGMLERFTEELSGLSEQAVTPDDRRRVMTLIGIVRQCMEAIVGPQMNPTNDNGTLVGCTVDPSKFADIPLPTVDPRQPVTSINVTFMNGKKRTFQVNTTMTVLELALLISAKTGRQRFKLKTGYPPRNIFDLLQSVEKAGLKRAHVIQSRV